MDFVLIPAGSFTMGRTSQAMHRMSEDFDRLQKEKQDARPVQHQVNLETELRYKRNWEKLFFLAEYPPHQVNITRNFYVQTTEVTNEQFQRFVNETGYRTTAETLGETTWTILSQRKPGEQKDNWEETKKGANWRHPFGPRSSIDGKSRHPVMLVSWRDAQAFCQWLSKKERKTYRLPTEAEWEYACRGPQSKLYPWGDELPPKSLVGNLADKTALEKYGEKGLEFLPGYDDHYAETAPVGSFKPNGFGLYDMVGNVAEWCHDFYQIDYYKFSPADDPLGPASAVQLLEITYHGEEMGPHRVIRGGSWILAPLGPPFRDRYYGGELHNGFNLGFRVIMDAE
jgi:formylglycine-generating enzyme required for sulfatase activity